MQPLFRRHKVQVVALSGDNVEVTAYMGRQRGYSFTLLADPDLKVIRQFGLEHPNGLKFNTIEILGLPIGYPVGFEAMTIPTSILIDETGIVRWIDQADDYRLRGDADRVEAALRMAFDAGT